MTNSWYFSPALVLCCSHVTSLISKREFAMECPWSVVHAWGSQGWSLLWEIVQGIHRVVHRQHSESLPAAARSIQSKHFLPFFLSFLIYKTGIAIQLPFGKHFEVYGQRTLVLYIGVDVFQPSCPLEIITLHSLGSRGRQSMVFSCSSLLMFVKPPLPWHSWSAAVYFSVTEGYGHQPLLQGHRGQSGISHRFATGQFFRRQLSQLSELVTLCLCTVPILSSPVQGHHWKTAASSVQVGLGWSGGSEALGWDGKGMALAGGP